MICPNCGAEAGTGAFCTSCGAKMPENAQPVYQAPETNYNNPAVNPAPAYNAYDAAPAQPKKNGTSTAALVLGIVGVAGNTILGCLCGCLGSFPTIICSIIGLVLGIKAKNEAAARGETDSKAKTGVILCIVALVLAVVITIINAVLGAAVYSEMY